MEYILVFFGIICVILGILGCILPVIPGTPLSCFALILLQWAKEEPVFKQNTLIIFTILTLIVSLFDYFLPLLGAKWYGISRIGTWGAFIGMILGILFSPPWGMILGMFMGAILGELKAGKENSAALKAGLVIFIGSIVSIFMKLSLSIVMAFYFFVYLFKN